MSLTIRKILTFPSLRGAKVVAGLSSLDRTITSVSVLEYSQPTELQEELIDIIEFEGNELVITGLCSIADDLEAQKQTVRRLAKAGEVGMLLYYVGTFVKEIDPSLIALADELDFVLIEMPHIPSLRYRDALSEINEAIIKEKGNDETFLVEMLESISRLPASLRTVSTVMSMLRERLRTSLVLSDMDGQVLNIASYPHGHEEELLALHSTASWASTWAVETVLVQGPQKPLRLTIVRESGQSLERREVEMLKETLHLFLSIWSPNHGQAVISQLVRAILEDDSLRMRRLASLFNIDVRSLDIMFLLKSDSDAKDLLEEVKGRIAAFVKRPIMDSYDGFIVLFLASSMGDEIIEAITETILELPLVLVRSFNLADTGDVRASYLEISQAVEMAHRLYGRRLLSTGDIRMVTYLLSSIAEGEESIRSITSILDPVKAAEDGTILLNTLSVYLLDGEGSTLKTSRLMNVHNNTVKYRLKRISSLLHDDMTRAPLSVLLYRALMAERALGFQTSG